MRIRLTGIISPVIAGIILCATTALAQDAPPAAPEPQPNQTTSSTQPAQTQSPTESTKAADVEITVVASRELVNFDAVDSGKTTISESAISILVPGFGDPNLLFETLPNVQYDGDQDRITDRTVQDLSPAQISIAGGRVYDNQFVIDGVGVNSVMDSVSDNPNNFNEVVGHPQTIYLEASLLEQATIYDSNVPAEFGGFTGGVVSFQVRSPLPRFSFSSAYSYTSDAWTQYVVSEENRTEPMPRRPQFEQERFDVRMDVPISESVSTLFAFTRSLATVSKAPDQSLFGDSIRQSTSTRDNFLARVRWDATPSSRFTFQTLWTPYEQEYLRFDTDTFKGGGLSSYIELDHAFDNSELTVKVSYNTNDNSRTSAPVFFMYLNTESTDWVPDSARSAQLGGFGDLDVTQSDLSLNATQLFYLDAFDLRVGLQASHIRAHRSRPEDNFTFRNGVQLGDFVTEDGTELRVRLSDGFNMADPAVIPNEQILTQRIDYLAHESNVDLNTLALWAESSKDLLLWDRLEVKLRWGLRYEYDEFLNNHNMGPRLSSVIKLPWDAALTIGLNRYYSRNMIAYKLRESYPDEFVYQRIPAITREFSSDFTRIIETRTYSDAWELRDHNRSPRYGQADLNTPYSDEISAALTFPLWIGQARIKVMRRENKEEFARSPGVTDTFVTEDGRTRTFTQYLVTNNGFTRYDSLSLEWQASWRKYVFDINATLSETENGGSNTFFTVVGDGDDTDSQLVFYKDRVLPFGEVNFIRSNFATPMIVNANVTRSFFDNRVVANMNFRYRAAFDSIEASLIRNADDSAFLNEVVVIDGIAYDVYRDERNAAILRLNLNLRWHVLKDTFGDWFIDFRVRNLTNQIPNTTATSTNPYQRGRSFWVEVKYRF